MQSKEFIEIWEIHKPMVEAIAELFYPLIEVAVHDLKEGKIAALYHNISQRKVGDPSPLNELKVNIEDFPPYFTPYYKKNVDGRSLKCTSITLRNKNKEALGLICFNVDVSLFEESHQMLEAFLKIKSSASHPVDAFGKEAGKETLKILNDYLKEKALSLKHLSRLNKRDIIWHLHQKGVFNFKNAVPLVAKTLSTSRATLYNYIKEIKR